MFKFPNGSEYKLLLIDSNILSNICKNKNNELENFIKRFILNRYAPCISFQSIIEIFNSRTQNNNLYNSFLDIFSLIPNIVLMPYRYITNQEIKCYLDKNVKFDIKKAMNSFTIFGQNETYTFKKWVETLINNSLPLLDCEYNETIVAAQQWQNEKNYYCQHKILLQYPDFEKIFFENFFIYENPELLSMAYDTSKFKAIRMMAITKYDRIHKCNKQIGKNDVNDTLISAYIPYMDAIIMENHQVEVVKQNITKIESLSNIGRYTMSSLL